MAVVAALCVLATVTFPIYDPDLWQHLRVGKTIWEMRAVPTAQLWSWPTYGAPDVLPSWLYRALLYPFWELAGVHGIFAWRWLTALAAAAFGYWTARRMGARGLAPFVAIVWCAVLFRMRSQARPETLVAIFMAAQLWLLEGRRAAHREGRSHTASWWIVLVALLWANVHISYYLGLILTSVYALDEMLRARRGDRAAKPWQLVRIALASAAVSFANPFTWKALWQPFEYFLYWRHEPIYTTIGELRPVEWDMHIRDGFPLWIALAVGLLFLRLIKKQSDPVQWVLYPLFLLLAIPAQRFVGLLAVAAAPFFARDLALWCADWRLPRGLQPEVVRTAITSVCLVAALTPELTNRPMNLGYGFLWSQYPVGACDWIEKHNVRGRMASVFGQAGYILWRFFPDRSRLPFMDIHQAGTREDRYTYAYAWSDSAAWRDLDQRHHFDYVLAPRVENPGVDILERLDADSTWRLVFLDDVSALYLRARGPLAALAERERYRYLAASLPAMGRVGELAYADTIARRAIRAELQRQIDETQQNAQAYHFLALLDLSEARYGDAVAKLDAALKVDPLLSKAREHRAVALDSLAAPRR